MTISKPIGVCEPLGPSQFLPQGVDARKWGQRSPHSKKKILQRAPKAAGAASNVDLTVAKICYFVGWDAPASQACDGESRLLSEIVLSSVTPSSCVRVPANERKNDLEEAWEIPTVVRSC
jgi:hypothetical protein